MTSSLIRERVPTAARWATALSLALNGLMFAAWTPHIPLVKDALGLSPGGLGSALLGAPLGSVFAIILAGRAVSRWGSRRVVLVTGVVSAVAAPLVALAGNGVALFLALLAWGGSGAAQGVGMNSQAVAVEQAYGRPILGGMQSCWNLGALVGAGFGIIMVHLDVALFDQQLVLAAIVILTALPICRRMRPDPITVRTTGARPALLDRKLLPLGIIGGLTLLSEGAAADWAAVYLREQTSASTTLAGTGFAVFAGTMFVGRAASDRLSARFGSVRLNRTMTAVAAAGFGAALLMSHPIAGIVGFALLGAGLSVVIPEVFRAGGRLPGRPSGESIAAISMFSWTGLLIGPPLIGFAAELTNLSVALGILCLTALTICSQAHRLTSPPPNPSPRPASAPTAS